MLSGRNKNRPRPRRRRSQSASFSGCCPDYLLDEIYFTTSLNPLPSADAVRTGALGRGSRRIGLNPLPSADAVRTSSSRRPVRASGLNPASFSGCCPDLPNWCLRCRSSLNPLPSADAVRTRHMRHDDRRQESQSASFSGCCPDPTIGCFDVQKGSQSASFSGCCPDLALRQLASLIVCLNPLPSADAVRTAPLQAPVMAGFFNPLSKGKAISGFQVASPSCRLQPVCLSSL